MTPNSRAGKQHRCRSPQCPQSSLLSQRPWSWKASPPGPELLYSLCILSSLAVFGVLLCCQLLFFFVPFLFPKAFWLIKHPVQKGENVWFPGFRAVGKQSPSQLRGFRESIGKIGYCTYTKYMYPYMIKHFYHVLGPGCCALLRTEWTFG